MIEQKKYGLFTSTAMVIGIVIGSGIFFKSDNILMYTDGNILQGVIVFCLAGIAIVFGGLVIGELASQTEEPGGLIAYAEIFSGRRTACAFGWFQVFIYYPILVAVVSRVIGIYIMILFGINGGIEEQILIGMAFMIGLFSMNILSARVGGYFQNAAMIIKLIPLIFIGILGVIFGEPEVIINSNAQTAIKSFSWLAAIGPVAFIYDGWIISTSIAHEVKDAKRNLPIALVVAPLLILGIYIVYFVGISKYIGPDNIIEMGDRHVYVAATNLIGNIGAKVLIIFIIISVAGVLNGVILGYIRLPYALAIRGMFPKQEKIGTIDEKYNSPIASAFIAFVISLFWLLLHYITQKANFLINSDISEVPVVMSYILYIVLYFKVFGLWKSGELKSKLRGIVYPMLATVGSLIILVGGLGSPRFFLIMGICVFVIIASAYYMQKKEVE